MCSRRLPDADPIAADAASAAALGISIIALQRWDPTTSVEDLASIVRRGFGAVGRDAHHFSSIPLLEPEKPT